ncbi:MAG: 3-keto-steroid reductase [Piccolia ochrophora]|nr:MAG: 3-keto-steroid reductase [Piccolia ochrophora]
MHDAFDQGFYVLVTGANGGLGLAICCRLIDEYLATIQAPRSIHLIFTTRSHQKGSDTVTSVQRHIHNRGVDTSRVFLQPEILDLTSLHSIRKLSSKLLSSLPRLDALILNAGSGGFTGVDWGAAIWAVTTDFLHALTWPGFKKNGVGFLTGIQLGSGAQEPPLGEVFCSNVFGHYFLSHQVMSLLSASSTSEDTRGRIIWVSSVEAIGPSFTIHDLQGLRSQDAYGSSKRLTDLLALTAHLRSTQTFVSRFLTAPTPTRSSPTSSTIPTTAPRIFLTHPGVCATSIVPLIMVASWAMAAAFYMARLLGSSIHTVTPYAGALAPVWIALRPQAELDDMEQSYGVAKWGSATDLWGRGHIERTEVDWWGYSGVRGETIERRRVRRRGTIDVTDEARKDFEEVGRECWREMEALREEWELLLDMTKSS